MLTARLFSKTKLFLTGIYVLVLLLITGSGISAQEISQGKKQIIIRGDKNYPPYEFLEDGKPTGFNVELIRAVAEVMELEVEIDLGNWDEVRRDLEFRRIDAITSMVYSKERDRIFDFSAPHFIASHAIFVRKESSIKSLEDIRGKEILVQKGDITHDYVDEKGLSAYIIPVDDQVEALRLLASGKHDCALLSKLVGLYTVNKYKLSNIKTVGSPILQLEYCFVVAEGNSVLLSQLNEGLSIIKETGKFKEIHDRWFGIYLKPLFIKTFFKYMVLILVPFVILLLVVLGWSWSLRRMVNTKTAELQEELAERKRAEKSLRESEDQFRTLFNATFEGIFIYDYKNGIIVEVNQPAASMIGYEPDELVGRNILDIVAKEYRDVIRQNIAAVAENPDITLGPYEILGLRKDGTTLYVEVHSKGIHYKGRALRLVGFRDISERKRMEKALQENEAKFRAITENTTDMTLIVGDEGKYTYTSPSVQKILGYTPDEISGRIPGNLTHPDDVPVVNEFLERAHNQEGKSLHLENFRVKHKNGHWIHLEGLFTCMIDTIGVNGLVINCRDITKRIKAEELLRESESKYRELVQNANSIILRLDTDGNIKFFNEFAQKFYGFSEEEILGKNAFGTIIPEVDSEGQDLREMFEDLLHNPGHNAPNENENILRSGKRVWISWTNKIVYDEYGNISEIFCVGHDVTERKKAREELIESEQSLRRMNEELVSIANNKTVISGNLNAAFREITEAAVNTLEVDSASIWIRDKDESLTACQDLFLRDKGKHIKGKKIDGQKYLCDIDAIQEIFESRVIAVSDIGTDRYFKDIYDHYFPDTGVTSMIKALVRSGGETTGVLSIDHVGPVRRWTVEEQNFAGSLADIVSIAIETSERIKAEKELEKKIALETLISHIASKFMDLSPFEMDIGINHALQKVGEFTGVDRIYVYIFNEDKTRMNNTHEWCGEGIEPQIDNLQDIDASLFPWWMEKLKKMEIIYIPSVDELPEEARIEKEILQFHNVKSELVVPFEFHKYLYGYIGFDTVYREKLWTDDSILLLEHVGGIIVNALEHKWLHEELREANEELEKKVEERTRELRQKQTQLVQSEKMAALGNLVAGVAHEINTPLGALKSNNDIFIRSVAKMKSLLTDLVGTEGEPKDPELAKLFSNVEKLNEVSKTASDRIVKIVNSLRTFARLDKAEMDTVDIHEGIESTLTLVHHELKRKVEVHKDFGNIPKISCYPNQLNQVFMNILVNAGHAIEDKGDIYIKTYARDKKAIIEIKDTGKGIPEDNLTRIFDPGFTTKSKGVGTGLGLSIVYQIIESHNGKIEVESEVGKGTLFRIILPV